MSFINQTKNLLIILGSFFQFPYFNGTPWISNSKATNPLPSQTLSYLKDVIFFRVHNFKKGILLAHVFLLSFIHLDGRTKLQRMLKNAYWARYNLVDWINVGMVRFSFSYIS